MAEKKNAAIVCCRTVSMFMIVLCHIIGNYTFIPGAGSLSQILNVGVYTFLAISGYLYGKKTISNFGLWFKNRWKTVVLPGLVIIAAVLVASLCAGEKYDVFSVFVYLLNLQGLGFFVPSFYRFFIEIEVLGPLWFLTVIVLCYCMVPVLQKIRPRILSWKHGYAIAVCLAAGCFALDMVAGINTVYLLTFAIGYCLSARNGGVCTRKAEGILLTALVFASQVLRLVLRAVCDGEPVYQTYTLISHMVLGIWILWFFLACGQVFPKLTSNFAEQKWMMAANDISFYVYLTHCCFCKGRLNMYLLTDNLFIATVGFAAATLISAIILKKIVKFILHNLPEHLYKPG